MRSNSPGPRPHIGIHWWEEVLHPDDFDGHRLLKQALPTEKWTTGEHEYSRYGFRKLIEDRTIDVLQPDVMWAGGLTELLRISAHAGAYDLPVVPHGSGPYSYHFVLSQPHVAVLRICRQQRRRRCRCIRCSAACSPTSPFRSDGRLDVADKPGFGLTLNPDVALTLLEPSSG